MIIKYLKKLIFIFIFCIIALAINTVDIEFDLFYLVYYLKAIEVSITLFSNTIDMFNFLFNNLLFLIFKGVIINVIIMFLINKTYGLLGGEQ